jgi:hypothetical protein
MPKTARPVRVYDFTAAARRNPATPPPGDRLSAQFDEHANRIVELQLMLEKIDGDLNLAAVDADERPRFLAEIRAAADEARAAAAQSLQAVVDAELKLRAVNAAAARIERRAHEAASFLQEVDRKVDEARGAAEALAQLARDPTPPNTPLEGPNLIRIDSGGWYATDIAGATATSADYAEVSINWAEYMPWTIPGNILAINAITGDHWSSRWWAHRAGEFVGGFLNGYYMGPFPTPPTQSLTGGDILLGALYFNTTDNVMYVWNGTAWIPFHTPQAAATGSFFYVATAGQTVFNLTQADIYGNLLASPLTAEEGIDVHLNGVRLAPWTAAFDGDYVVDLPTSSIILRQGAQDAALVAVDVLLDKAKLAPAFVAIEKLRPFPVDGVTTTFPLIDSTGAQLTLLDASQLDITLDGVPQEPGRDYALDVTGQQVVFLVAPGADSNVFTIWFSNSLIGSGGSIVVVHDLTLRGQGTVAQPLGVVEATAVQQGAVHVPNISCLTIAPDGALGVTVANAAQIVNATNNVHPVTSLRLRDVTGADVATLNTTAKTIVPAINELVQLIAGSQQVIGAFNATTGQARFTVASGYPNGLLPAATTVAAGKYVIVEVAGTPTVGPLETRVQAEVGDWWLSDNNLWNLLNVGTQAILAANVGLIPNVYGQDNVQDALEFIENLFADEPYLPLTAGATVPLTGSLFGTSAVFNGTVGTVNLAVSGVATITGPNSLLLTAAAGQPRAVIGATLNLARWQLVLGDQVAEGGGNVGSNFELNAFSDAGGLTVRALLINRVDGRLTLVGDPIQPLHAATKAYVDALRGLVFIGDLPPTNPQPGALWWRTDPDGQLFIWYDDGTSQQWVVASPGGGGGGGGTTNGNLPPGGTAGQLLAKIDAADFNAEWVDVAGTGVDTDYFKNRYAMGPANPDTNDVSGAYTYDSTTDWPVQGPGHFWILNVFEADNWVLQEGYYVVTAGDRFDAKYMRYGRPGQWSAWVRQPIDTSGGTGNFLPLTGGTMSGTITSQASGPGLYGLQHVGAGALQIGLMMMSTSAPGGGFSLSYQSNDNERFRISHTTSGVPVTTHRVQIDGANGPLALLGVVQVARAPTAPTDVVNRAYVDALPFNARMAALEARIADLEMRLEAAQ